MERRKQIEWILASLERQFANEPARPSPRTRRDSRRDVNRCLTPSETPSPNDERVAFHHRVTYAALWSAVPHDRSALATRDNKTSSLDLA
jgi:hypothetical protein